MADLIPDEAWTAASKAFPHGIFWKRYEREIRDLMRAAAPHILAAELERWAEHCEAESAKYAHLRSDGGRNFAASGALRNLAAHHLRARAAELRSTTEGDTTHG